MLQIIAVKFFMSLITLHLLDCQLLETFANSMDPDQARQNVRPDLDPNYLTLMVLLKYFLEKVDFKGEKIQRTKKHEKLPVGKELMVTFFCLFDLILSSQ